MSQIYVRRDLSKKWATGVTNDMQDTKAEKREDILGRINCLNDFESNPS